MIALTYKRALPAMLLAFVFRVYFHFRGWYEEKRFGYDLGHIKQFPFGMLLKLGRGNVGPEADTVRHIRAHTTIPVPRVFASARGFGYTYMLMEEIAGDDLEYVWPKLTSQQRKHIVEQLRSFVRQLRNLPPIPSNPPGAVCSLYNAALHDSRIASATPVGPFPDESAFNDHLIRVALPFMDETTLPGIRARMRDDHRIVFTHGDLAPRNIIVRGDVVVALVDWEESGWYPEHWEIVKALWCPMFRKDLEWEQAVRDIISHDYERDLKLDRELSDHMVGGF